MTKITLKKLESNLSFTREEYEKKRKSKNLVTFDKFLKNVIDIVKSEYGTLEDAIFIAEDAFEKLY